VKVLSLLASNGWGGAERLGCTLFRMAREAGHEVRVEAFGAPALAAGIRDELGDDPAVRVGESGLWRWALGARARVRAFEPDLIHAHLAWPSLGFAVATVAAKRPLVLTFHLLPGGASWPKDYLLRIRSAGVIRASGRFAPRRILTAVSAGDQRRLRDTFPRDRVELVLNAPPLPPLSLGSPAEIDWRVGAVRLLSVARICQQKGLDRLARALASTELGVLPWHWVIVGEGDARSALERQVTELGIGERVHFAGSLPAHALLRTADLVLSPSRWEGMPLVPLEAVLSGVPLVASRIAPHIELFGGIETALLPADEAEWPAALARLVGSADARSALRSAQSALVPALGRERMWREYDAIYRELGQRTGTGQPTGTA
jgi:glycosyltransferase involved in cell wall biosynthesis